MSLKTRTDVSHYDEQAKAAASTLRERLANDPEALEALAVFESVAAVGLRVMSDTNASKVRKHAQAVWIQHLTPKA